MNTLLYLLQASLLLLGLFVAFWYLLRAETFFQLNRLILGLIALCVMLMPLLPVPHLFPTLGMAFTTESIQPVEDQAQSIALPTITTTEISGIADRPVKEVKFINFGNVILNIYWIGVFLFAFRLFVQLVLLLQLLWTSKWKRESSFLFIESPKPIKPFSFFYFIVYNPAALSFDALQQVKEHEQVHSRQWHSLDILLGEIFCVLFWFHPLSWKLAKYIRLNLEYLADQVILRKGFEKKSYQYSLLQVALNGKNLRLTNNFNQSLIKKRIIMMNAKQSPDTVKWKYLLMLPLLLGLVLFINQAHAQKVSSTPKATTITSKGVNVGTAASATSVGSSKATPASTGTVSSTGSGSNATGVSSGNAAASPSNGSGAGTDISDGDGETIYFLIRSNVDKKTLDSMTEGIAKEGIKVSFPELEYNAEGLITRIKIMVDSDNGINGNLYSDNGAEAIEGPVGFYILFRGEKRHFGTVSGNPDNLRLPEKTIKFIKGSTGYFKGDFSG